MTRTVTALGTVVVLCVGLPPAVSAAVLTGGVLTGPDGAPAAGQVRVYAWASPARGRTLELPLLGSAAAGPDGSFTVSTLDDRQLQALAARRDGWVDFTVVGATAGHTGRWGFTAYVDSLAGRARVSNADSVLQAGTAAASDGVRTPFVRVRAARPNGLARAAQIGGCDTKFPVRALGSVRKLTLVGELNNAYNDGTTGTFT